MLRPAFIFHPISPEIKGTVDPKLIIQSLSTQPHADVQLDASQRNTAVLLLNCCGCVLKRKIKDSIYYLFIYLHSEIFTVATKLVALARTPTVKILLPVVKPKLESIKIFHNITSSAQNYTSKLLPIFTQIKVTEFHHSVVFIWKKSVHFIVLKPFNSPKMFNHTLI